ncbi:MAG TPA: ATP-binding protein, partial [Tahibacter sp.]|nr:ATP-binding protein [Tahibacter sp.]
VVRVAEDAAAVTATACGFCGRALASTRKMRYGKNALICDVCVVEQARALHASQPHSPFDYVWQLLDWHYGGVAEKDLVVVRRNYSPRMRVDLVAALERAMCDAGAQCVGFHYAQHHDSVTMSSLLVERERWGKHIAPLQYEDVDVGDAAPARCLTHALWLLRDGDAPVAVLMVRQSGRLAISVASPPGDTAHAFAERVFRRLGDAVKQASSYRGKVLSLEFESDYDGRASGITVHRLPPVARDAVVLPEATLQLLERNVVNFAAVRSRLIALGQSGKKGLLFHGPPGTGKTHTVRWLAACLPDHTTLLVTAEQIGGIGEYFSLARLLQPAILVIEDADLIARERGHGGPCEETLLNRLLNEMDGLKPDAELFVVLTTNRPHLLEAALAQRPGRVDQAIEFPLPDRANRLRLVELYRARLALSPALAERIAQRTDGVSAAFVKELMRRIAQSVVERGDADENNAVTGDDVDRALGELALGRDGLGKGLLGAA